MNRNARDRARGQALVEFAVALPLIAALVLGLFDAGRVVISYTTLTNAARVGARVAIVNQSNDATCDPELSTFKCAAAAQAIGVGIEPADIADVVISGTDCDIPGNCDVTVTLSRPVEILSPLIGTLMGPFNLSASTTMEIERPYVSP